MDECKRPCPRHERRRRQQVGVAGARGGEARRRAADPGPGPGPGERVAVGHVQGGQAARDPHTVRQGAPTLSPTRTDKVVHSPWDICLFAQIKPTPAGPRHCHSLVQAGADSLCLSLSHTHTHTTHSHSHTYTTTHSTTSNGSTRKGHQRQRELHVQRHQSALLTSTQLLK